ncbi:hypothetical protein ACE4RU_11480 [Actinobacillus seminis]|uniref:hypothetical protein n=1 Tax=Actinobacillus seminis TaxID=722 RepID=UPI003B936A97
MNKLLPIFNQNAIRNLSEFDKWQLYEKFKKRLREQNLTQKQYEQRINEALEVLGL